MGYITKKLDSTILCLFILILVVTRIPFMSKNLYDWDSVNYALALQNFNINLSQPQAPGYIFFVAFGKAINSVFHDPNASFIFISIFFSILTVILIYYLAKQMFNREIAVVASIFLIFNPCFWFYGETTTIYMSEALFASLVAYTSYQLLRGDSKFIYISSLALGLSGGFRQDLIVFMFPLWFFCFVFSKFNYKQMIKSFIVLIISVGAWLIPTILLSGGFTSYFSMSHNEIFHFFQIYSIFYGGSLTSQLSMDNLLLLWTMMEIGVVSLFLVGFYIFLNYRKIKFSNFKNRKIFFLTLWVLPAFLFYLLLYIAKPGYTLVYLPVFSLISGYLLVNISQELHKRFSKIPSNYIVIWILSLFIVLSSLQFVPSSIPEMNYGDIKSMDTVSNYINESLNNFNSANTIVFYPLDDNFRKSEYYFPNFNSYSYSYYIISGKRVLQASVYKNHKMYSYFCKNMTINVNSSTTKVVWLIDYNTEFFYELKSKINMKEIKLSDGNIVYYSELRNNTNFTVNHITFIKK